MQFPAVASQPTRARSFASFAVAAVLAAHAGAATAQINPGSVAPGANQPTLPAPPPAEPQAGAAQLSVPPVVERPLGEDEGARVAVTRFVLEGAKDHPETGLLVADLERRLAEAQAAQPPGGYTVNQLQRVAETLRDEYRRRGFVLAQAFVPAQEIANGEVRVTVLEGRLGAIRVEDNKRYDADTLRGPFAGAVGRAVNEPDVEARLLRLNDYPGLSVFGVFTPGANVGDSDLVLKVQRERPVEFTLAADNFGNPFSGEYRAHAGLTWNDALGFGDRLRLFALRAQATGGDDGDATYGSIDYRAPFSGGRGAITAGFSLNDYAVGGALSGFASGEAQLATLGGEWEFQRSRLGRGWGFLNLQKKDADFTAAGLRTERLTGAELGYAFERLDRGGQGRWTASASATFGRNSVVGDCNGSTTCLQQRAIRASSAEQYTVLRVDLDRLQRITDFQRLRLHVQGQWSGDALPSLEQIALGGPSTVRAYEIARYVGDTGVYAGAEYYLGAPGFAARPGPGARPWGEVLQFVAFYDYANGQVEEAQAGEIESDTLMGYGLGLVIRPTRGSYLRVDVSKPVSASEQDELQPYYESTRYYAAFGITF